MTRILKPVDDLVWSVESLEAPPPARLVEQLNLAPAAGVRSAPRRAERPSRAASEPPRAAVIPAPIPPASTPVLEPRPAARPASTVSAAAPAPWTPAAPPASPPAPAIRERIFNDDLRQAAAAVLEHPPRKRAGAPPAPAREPAGLLDDPLFHSGDASDDAEDLRGEFLGEILSESDLNIEGDIDRVRQDSFQLQPEAHAVDSVQSVESVESVPPTATDASQSDDLLQDLLPDDDELGELALSPGLPTATAAPAAAAVRVPLDFDPLREQPMQGADPALQAALDALYAAGALHEDDFRPALDYLLNVGAADSAALLYFEPEAQSYRPLLARNLDEDTRRNFAIGVADTYINARRDLQVIRLDDTLKRDRQFRKRFSVQFFEDNAALIVFNLRAVGADGFLALGYRKAPAEDRARLMENLTRATLDLAPLFERYRMHRWARRVVSNEDSIMVSEAVEALKLVSRNGGFTVHTIHVRFPELLERDDWRARIESLARRASLELGPDERLFINGPDRLLAVLHPEHATAFRACVEMAASGLQLSALIGGGVYPDEGKNFYNYIALPPELTPGRESAAP